MRRFGPEDRLSRTEDMLSTELDQETILMSIDAGAYYGLEGVARSICFPRTVRGNHERSPNGHGDQ